MEHGASSYDITGTNMEDSEIIEQPAPQRNELRPTWELVIEDMQERNSVGIQRYGTPLQPFNGRNNLIDAYFEVLDQAVYLRNRIEEEANPRHGLKDGEIDGGKIILYCLCGGGFILEGFRSHIEETRL